MKEIRIVAFDVESCSANRKFPTYSDLIIGISVHTASSIDPCSKCQGRMFIAEELTFEAEEKIIVSFLDILKQNSGAVLTAYNLIGFDEPILLSRSKEHYPLSFRLLDVIHQFSLYDTMIAYKTYARNPKSCNLKRAIEQLTANGHDCFSLKSKSVLSGKEVLGLWAKEMAGISKEFSTYAAEDSYNHLRLAQVLLSSNVKEGLWFSESHNGINGKIHTHNIFSLSNQD